MNVWWSVALMVFCAGYCYGSGDTSKVKTFYEASGEEHDGVCQCTIATSWSEMKEYKELQDTRARLDKAFKVQDSMDYPLILDQLANYTERLQVLEESINNQSIATSVTELFTLRKAIADLVEKVKLTETKETAGDIRNQIYSELKFIKNFADEAWARNPYKQRNHYEEQLSILREQLYKDGAKLNGTAFQGDLLPTELPPSKSWCNNGNVNFGRPETHNYTKPYRGHPTRGAWCKDPSPLSAKHRSTICQMIYGQKRTLRQRSYHRNSYGNSYYQDGSVRLIGRCFGNYSNFVRGKSEGEDMELSKLGAVLYKDSLFYIASGDILTKMNLATKVKTTVRISSSAYTYLGGSSDSTIDIKVDEQGLWLIYSITSDGNIAISKIDADTLVIQRTWITSQDRRRVCAAFIMCGKMYTVKTCNKNLADDESNYVYDMQTSEGTMASYHFSSLYGGVSALLYNSRERAVFGWDNGHMVTYPIIWSGTMS